MSWINTTHVHHAARPGAFCFAGLWETWHDKQDPDELYRCCTIITREAAGAVKELHHRMPLILEPDAYGHWFDSDNRNDDSINEILHSKTITDLIFYPLLIIPDCLEIFQVL